MVITGCPSMWRTPVTRRGAFFLARAITNSPQHLLSLRIIQLVLRNIFEAIARALNPSPVPLDPSKGHQNYVLLRFHNILIYDSLTKTLSNY